ncbi:MAG: histidine kinase [Planctomycetota bacterium]|nr:MAG: histidine kinase [Planctomycetota bacterium]
MKATEIEAQRNSLHQSSKFQKVHWFVLLFSLFLTYIVWSISNAQVHQKIKIKFDRESDQVLLLVKERMALYENALWGGVSLIDAYEKVSYQEWKTYTKSLQIEKRYAGINGIGVIYNLQKDGINKYLTDIQKKRPNFNIHPKHNQSEYWPIELIEPYKQNAKAVGLDMAFEKNRYGGILKARDSGTAQVTGPIILVQDSKKTPGFLFYAPFYKNANKPNSIEEAKDNILGVIYSPFIMSNLMEGVLAESNRHVNIKVYDSKTLLYADHINKDSKFDPEPIFTRVSNINMYGRIWNFKINSNLDFRDSITSEQSNYILFGGIFIDLLLLALFILLARSNKAGLKYADLITKDLQIKTTNLEKSNTDLEEFAYIASHDLKSPLRAISNIGGWLAEDLKEVINSDEAIQLDADVKLETKENLLQLKGRTQRMEKLLSDLLAYSKVGKENHAKETIDINSLISNITELQNISEKFKINLTNDSIAKLKIEKAPIEIVLRNIISNAIKHNDKQYGNVEIYVKEENNKYKFVITDDGPGIPLDQQEKVFKLFQTLKPRDQVEGSGMGLTIIRKIIESHNGSVKIETPQNKKGTSIVFTWENSG